MRKPALATTGAACLLLGLGGVAFGSLWAQPALSLSEASGAGLVLDSLVPFAPIGLIALGAALIVRARA